MADEDIMDSEDKEADVYGDNAREDLAENDEITPEEQAFMDGYDEGEDLDEKTDNDKYEKAFESEESTEDKDLEEEEDYDEEF